MNEVRPKIAAQDLDDIVRSSSFQFTANLGFALPPFFCKSPLECTLTGFWPLKTSLLGV